MESARTIAYDLLSSEITERETAINEIAIATHALDRPASRYERSETRRIPGGVGREPSPATDSRLENVRYHQPPTPIERRSERGILGDGLAPRVKQLFPMNLSFAQLGTSRHFFHAAARSPQSIATTVRTCWDGAMLNRGRWGRPSGAVSDAGFKSKRSAISSGERVCVVRLNMAKTLGGTK